MSLRRAGILSLVLLAGCGGTEPTNGGGLAGPEVCDGLAPADTSGRVRVTQGGDGCAPAGEPLPHFVEVRVLTAGGAPSPGVVVRWSVVRGGGGFATDSSVTDAHGLARAAWTLGAPVGGQSAIATVDGLADTARFHATAQGTMSVAAGGNNVGDRYTSDLWVRGSYAYTGTWGTRTGHAGNVTKVWDVAGGVTLVDSLIIPNVGTISDNEVSPDGTLLLATGEYGSAPGLYLYSLADPAHPALVGSEPALGYGLHTGTFADIGGARYVFAARDPKTAGSIAPAWMIYRIQVDSTDPIVLVDSLQQPPFYGIHDTYVRDGLAFVADWDKGVRIYDVGSGAGSPDAPVLLGSASTSTAGLECECAHNSWWYHDSAGGTRYLFVGQEASGLVGSASSGDIHVVDVSDLAHPREVASFHVPNAGTHNFWVDETRGILYAAYYNAGVVAIDVTGELRGDLASREIATLRPGGNGDTYVWGVMLANGSLWVSDMLSGLWKVTVP